MYSSIDQTEYQNMSTDWEHQGTGSGLKDTISGMKGLCMISL